MFLGTIVSRRKRGIGVLRRLFHMLARISNGAGIAVLHTLLSFARLT
jgi:hypothetical protein